jgi:hypothetical protein
MWKITTEAPNLCSAIDRTERDIGHLGYERSVEVSIERQEVIVSGVVCGPMRCKAVLAREIKKFDAWCGCGGDFRNVVVEAVDEEAARSLVSANPDEYYSGLDGRKLVVGSVNERLVEEPDSVEPQAEPEPPMPVYTVYCKHEDGRIERILSGARTAEEASAMVFEEFLGQVEILGAQVEVN